jgi:dTDP-4-dehydrorhamnose reductase
MALKERVAEGEWDWLWTDLTELDITDKGKVEVFFDLHRPDVVVNCAAFTDVDRAETEREAAYRVNRDAPRFLAEAAAALGTALIHVSTDFVYGANARGGFSERTAPYTEEDEPAPLNVYGESKLAGEKAVEETGVRGAVVRTAWLYSPWGKNFVKSILRVASEREEIRVVDDQTGCPTSAASLAGAIFRMIPSLGAMGVYHFCDSGVVSRADFAVEIIRRAGLDCRVVPVPTSDYPLPARRPVYSALDTGKFTRTFGIAPRPWRQELSLCIARLKNPDF